MIQSRRYMAALASAFVLVFVGCSNTPQPGSQATDNSAPAVAASSAQGSVTGKVPGTGGDAFVVLTPKTPSDFPPPTVQPTMDQVQMTFIPDLLIARAGYPVSFQSSDPELHNINVSNTDTRKGEFNSSILPGGKIEHTFERPGFYAVRCDIHPAMAADILVTSSPFAALTGDDGAFAISAVPPGAYTVTVYRGAARLETTVDVTNGLTQVQFER